MLPYGRSYGRQVSAGKSEGRFLEPSQLTLQASGSTIVEKPRDGVRPAFDFRLTKDTGVIRAAGGEILVNSNSAVLNSNAINRRISSSESQGGSRSRYPIPSITDYAGYLQLYSQDGELSDSGITAKKPNRSSSASVMNGPASKHAEESSNPADVVLQRHQDISIVQMEKLQELCQCRKVTVRCDPATGYRSLLLDKVVFSESASVPGVPIIIRSPEEKASNPDRLNLDRRRLAVCPILDGEDQLRLLNYQHNFIKKISNLHSLKKLIFLDLYDNHIEEITGLSNLKSLRVLMLGKNKIKKIENLDSLTKLDVLDLHGNELQIIENLNHLAELRVLNLAGNKITYVDNLQGMLSLAELNLRRNHIRSISEVELLPNLQRLFLSCNELSSFDDIHCLTKSISLQEVSLDGNPFSTDQFYKQTILSNLQNLKQLDMKRVTDEEKRIAAVMARKEEDRRRELQKISMMKERRKQAIHTAKKQWEMMQSSMMGKSNRLTRMPELYASHVGTYDNPNNSRSHDNSFIEVSDEDTDDQSGGTTDTEVLNTHNTPVVQNSVIPPTDLSSRVKTLTDTRPTNPLNGLRPDPVTNDRGNGLAELDNDTLSCYGPGSVDSLDRNWGVQAAGAVTTIVFNFIEFGDVVNKAFSKIRTKFPAAHTYLFNANNIHSLEQLNALSQIRRIENLTINDEGNPVTQLSLWKPYLIFRLAHFSIKNLNGQEITASDIILAEKLFGPVGIAINDVLPNYRLVSLLPEPRKKMVLSEEKMKAAVPSEEQKSYGAENNNRAVLGYNTVDQLVQSKQEQKSRLKLAHSMINTVSMETIASNQALSKLSKVWEKSLSSRIGNICLEMDDYDTHSKQKYEAFVKEQAMG